MRDPLTSFYQPGAGFLHRLSAGPKMAGALAFILGLVLLPRFAWWAFSVAFLLLAALLWPAGIAPRAFMRRWLLLEPFAVGVALLALFQPDGVARFLDMLVRSSLCLGGMTLLATSTRFSAMVRVLWRCRLPPILVTTLSLMSRYLFVLLEEMQRLQRARKSRTFITGRRRDWRLASGIIGHLFLRTSERAERVYAAMCARGWKT